jgi:hypothetical protein
LGVHEGSRRRAGVPGRQQQLALDEERVRGLQPPGNPLAQWQRQKWLAAAAAAAAAARRRLLSQLGGLHRAQEGGRVGGGGEGAAKGGGLVEQTIVADAGFALGGPRRGGRRVVLRERGAKK